MGGLVDRIRYRLRDAKHHQKQDSYGGLYDADNGVMLTGEISQDMLGGYNKTVLQYANKGLAQNMVSPGRRLVRYVELRERRHRLSRD